MQIRVQHAASSRAQAERSLQLQLEDWSIQNNTERRSEDTKIKVTRCYFTAAETKVSRHVEDSSPTHCWAAVETGPETKSGRSPWWCPQVVQRGAAYKQLDVPFWNRRDGGGGVTSRLGLETDQTSLIRSKCPYRTEAECIYTGGKTFALFFWIN